MLEPYRRVFAHRGALAFSTAGLVARLPISMMTLGIVLLVTAVSDSYTRGGAITAAFVAGNAALAILQGRFADRFGQTLVLLVDMVLFGLFSGLLVRAVVLEASLTQSLLWAAAAGAVMPQVGSMIRTRWTHVVADDGQRQTAFAVEAVADEIVFVTGPALVTFLATSFAPQTGLIVAVAIGTVGSLLLASQRATCPPPQPASRPGGVAAMPWLRILPIGIAAIAMGSLFAALEVITVAVAEDAGHRSMAGVLLAVFSAGSLVSGFVAGTIAWRASALGRFQVGIAILSVAMVGLPFLNHLPTLAVALFLIGLALAPTLIAIVSLVEASTPRSRLTEAMAVFQTGLSAGLAPGAWIGGYVADHTVGAQAYWVCVGCGLLATLASLTCRQPAPGGGTDLAPPATE